tara:strand:- start:119 stop:454 length:336 start_codon:yes stop_codon:yes gene_type:complete
MSTTPVFEPVLEEIAKRTSVDINRLNVSPTAFSKDDFTPMKYIMLDGERLSTGWSPELEQDVNMPLQEWHKFVDEFERKLGESIIENACRDIRELNKNESQENACSAKEVL